jgi:hypothetical protein
MSGWQIPAIQPCFAYDRKKIFHFAKNRIHIRHGWNAIDYRAWSLKALCLSRPGWLDGLLLSSLGVRD